ncbi:type VI secretion system lipoprotein TssJ [[Erwinia] mediterraneensis]|uniref:type VI secretion system lipoprotein TssJ n=1 Tax=[Erwinia] mediterraneensis TaxID=2161819 RepID=UPI00102FF065|nr:type VI secretion system lipoprotein TssJ [[Erwinia] mediterraneensis]
MRPVIILLMFWLAATVSGCTNNTLSGTKTERVLVFSADKDINPNEFNQPAPLNVFIYQLRATEQFMEQQDEFFSPGKNPAGFAKDIIAAKEMIIRPGERQEVLLPAAPEEVAVGLVAAFRNINKSEWKRVILLQEQKKRPWYDFFSSPEKMQLNIHLKKLSFDDKVME